MNEHLSPDLLVDYVHGELSATDDASVHRHLAACASCRESYDLEIALSEGLRAAAAADERELPPFVKATIWEAVREARPSPLARLGALLRPAIAVPVAALLIAGGFFASPLAHVGAAPTIDATYYLEAHAAQASQSPLNDRSGVQSLETSMLAHPSPPLLGDLTTTGYAASALDAVR
jgi:anti-sigma factor RsiW